MKWEFCAYDTLTAHGPDGETLRVTIERRPGKLYPTPEDYDRARKMITVMKQRAKKASAA